MKLAMVATALLLTFSVARAIRYLKEGPVVDAEGRQYKSPPLRVEEKGLGEPATSAAVRVHCTDTSVMVVVKANLFKTGRLSSPGELFLGEALDPRCQAAAATNGEYVIMAELQDCGSTLTASKDSMIYSNKLVFSPTYGTPPVSRNAQQGLTSSAPTQHHTFALQLMTADDWLRERASKVFHLGETLHLQAYYAAPDSGQRRVFIDSCVATLSPDPGSVPRYYFIENHGCLVDTKQGGLNSQFQLRRMDHALRLKLEVFLFNGDSRNSIFITCQLKATSKTWGSGLINKACNYERSRWKNLDGNDDVCQCCDGTCSQVSESLTCGSVSVGPLTVYPRK
ncbi:hypothetical protein fugu_015456 [Takifugu bimaculatus]|uniref:Zona pellucida sperm-binding protein 3 n=1 Tax=Takifugu bimaculatus TaxID=433685 RepID=A0A4Z2C0T9_9TELE|nr:hypothetical protein fugu_015456 [Takifugu bimaculatus]